MADVVKGTKRINAGASEFNAIQFLIQQALRGQIHTAIPCKVEEVIDRKYVHVLPLVTQIDGYDERVEPATLYKLPFFRYHAGVCAFIVDPVPGDIGLAVFAQSDSSNVVQGTDTPQQPGSFRKYSMADGFYLGGFLNRDPSVYIELNQDGNITVIAPKDIQVDTPLVNITGDCVIGGISFLGHVHDCHHGAATTPPHS